MKLSAIRETKLPWTDTGGHIWKVHENVKCVECPHCGFVFASNHTTAPEGYVCPNCPGCPDEKEEGASMNRL